MYLQKYMFIILLIGLLILSSCSSEITNKDLFDYCEAQQDEEEIVMCYGSIGKSLKDISVCDNVFNEKKANNCFYGVGLNGDIKDCKNITKDYYHDWCVYGVATTLKNPEICGNTKNSLVRDICYDILSELTNNVIVCDSIDNSTILKDCKNKFLK